MGDGNVCHCTHNGFPEPQNSVVWMPIEIPLYHAPYLIEYSDNIWGAGRSHNGDNMVMKIFGHPLLGCMSLYGLVQSLVVKCTASEVLQM